MQVGITFINETALGNKRIYCFINSNLCEPYRKRKCCERQIWHKRIQL